MLTNFALPRHPIETEQVSFTLKGVPTSMTASDQRIDAEHANARRRWEEMGNPDYLNAAAVDELKDASELRSTPIATKYEAGLLSLNIALTPPSVAAVHLTPNAR